MNQRAPQPGRTRHTSQALKLHGTKCLTNQNRNLAVERAARRERDPNRR